MVSAKDIVIKPIKAKAANDLVKLEHYSGKVVPNSQLHFGAYLNGKLEGAMSFGPCMKKKPMMRLVAGTKWNGFIELNRMAFSDKLPRNSESRCISVALKEIKKHYPHIEWVVSFADACQCGDGGIYRASGFWLTGVKKNSELKVNPRDGKAMATMAAYHKGYAKEISGWAPIIGFQLRYIYFLNKEAQKRLTVPIIPFNKIDELGAGMYKGIKKKASEEGNGPDHGHSGGSTPTRTLQPEKV